MTSESALLDISALETGYRHTQVLRGINATMSRGERVGLFGPNGHGKTTLFRAVSGLIRAWAGSVQFAGQDITNRSARAIVELGLVHVPQGNTLFPRMTVSENLDLGAFPTRARAMRKQNLDMVLTVFPRLAERRTQQAMSLSGGERQMASIAMGLMSAPMALLLDEPTLGLAPKAKEALYGAIEAIGRSGVSMVIVDQDIEFLQSLTSRMYLLQQGLIVLEMDAEHMLDNEQIAEMYFGIHDL